MRKKNKKIKICRGGLALAQGVFQQPAKPPRIPRKITMNCELYKSEIAKN
jgi:hypothetical protein